MTKLLIFIKDQNEINFPPFSQITVGNCVWKNWWKKNHKSKTRKTMEMWQMEWIEIILEREIGVGWLVERWVKLWEK